MILPGVQRRRPSVQADPIPPLTLTYRGTQTDTTNRSSYNAFTSFTVSATDTFVIIALYFVAGSALGFNGTCTITGNNSGSRTVNTGALPGNTSTVQCGFIYATLDGDTSVTVTFNLTGTGTCGAFAAWSGEGVLSTAAVTVDTTHSYSLSVGVDDGGIGLVASINSNTSSPTITVTGTGWNKDTDITMEGGIKAVAVSAVGPNAANCNISYSSNTSPGLARSLEFSAAA